MGRGDASTPRCQPSSARLVALCAARHGASIEIFEPRRPGVPGEHGFGTLLAGGREAMRALRVVEEFCDGVGERIGISSCNEDATLAPVHNLGYAAAPGADDRDAGGHRLGDGHAEGLVPDRWEDKERG